MKRLLTALAVIVLAGQPLPGYAQQLSTVGDLLDHGGKKLTKEELQRTYSGAIISGTQAGKPQVTFKNNYMANGTVAGDSWNNGTRYPVTGVWFMNDSGQVCNTLNGGTVKRCIYYFSLIFTK